jgi:hypothetical protein
MSVKCFYHALFLPWILITKLDESSQCNIHTVMQFWVQSISYTIIKLKGHTAAQWLRHYATSWKVVGLRPDEVN